MPGCLFCVDFKLSSFFKYILLFYGDPFVRILNTAISWRQLFDSQDGCIGAVYLLKQTNKQKKKTAFVSDLMFDYLSAFPLLADSQPCSQTVKRQLAAHETNI